MKRIPVNTILLFTITTVFTVSLSAGTARCETTAAMEKEPYLLFTGNNAEMQILWQLTGTDDCILEWGTDTEYTIGSEHVNEYGSDHQYQYTIEDLTPGTTYYYRVIACGDTFPSFFRTVASASTNNLKFFVYGDTRTNPDVHNDIAGAIIDEFTSDPDFLTFILHTGDMVSDGESESYWNSQFFSPAYENIREMMSRIPMQACIGNHEGDGKLFVKYFPYPFVSDRYWSFDYGPIHVVVVDQFTDYAPGSEQLNWIDRDLASTTKAWKFMIFHMPGWSAGGHSNCTDVQQYLQPLCVEHGVSICFSGHNHYYSRAVVEGIQHITTGGGGAPLYSPNPGYPYIVTTAEEHHYCKLEIDHGHLFFTALKTDGTVLDSFTIDNQSLVGGEGPSEDQIPDGTARLAVPFPNPFNPEVVISFQVNKAGVYSLSVFDTMGKLIKHLAADYFDKGNYSIRWNGGTQTGRQAASGIYIVRLTGNGCGQSQKLVLIK